ncbi:MAG: hypothetical protein DMF63_00390 [Acidobacteria bacterium]|nr:MAG: hypothetical protein DMF63_00390 [Acidobacteriota bacterium]
MVDMSPSEVTERLRLMGELWELSVKLMDSKKVVEQSVDLEFEKQIGETSEDARTGSDSHRGSGG